MIKRLAYNRATEIAEHWLSEMIHEEEMDGFERDRKLASDKYKESCKSCERRDRLEMEMMYATCRTKSR